ncbi:NEL-type E3 ubiquitin ligase domain-containing protein [Pseudomonas sp. L1(2025)]|uniref:NEL-type E3 ubiquitin ligase domain-containing protein n=1 Tax=Pseudomonas sp. L1(2025) TaxID=3449429 RepID=UPI003F68C598
MDEIDSVNARVDVQSIHAAPIREHIPGWYADASLRRKRELAGLALEVPDFYRTASASSREAFHAAHADGWAALNAVDRVFDGLKDSVEFVEPLLVEAIKTQLNLDLDVRRTFYARKIYYLNRVDERSDFGGAFAFATGVGGPRDFYYSGTTLLEAAMGNFSAAEALPGECGDCHLITQFDFHADSEILPTEFAVKRLALTLPACRFADLCRRLDLGKQYQAHVDAVLLPVDEPGTEAGTAAMALLGALVKYKKTRLEVEARIAFARNHIKADSFQMLIDYSAYRLSQKDVIWREFNLRCSTPTIEGVQTRQLMLFYTEAPRSEDFVLYVPGDPDKPLMEYTSLWNVADDLARRLCSFKYRVFFSQFIPVEHQHEFFAAIQRSLDPDDRYSSQDDLTLDSNAGHHRPRIFETTYYVDLHSWARQKLTLIRNNAKALVVSTADQDSRARREWLQAVGSAALDVFNLASFVVPGLGPLMMVVGAVQMMYELEETVAAFRAGDTKEAWAHVSGVMLNLAFVAAGHKLIPALSESEYVKGWVHVVSPQGKTRLAKPNLEDYQHVVALPPGARPDSQGVYTHAGKRYLPAQDGRYYELAWADDVYTLRHPSDLRRYTPRATHNGMGAWVYEFEQPLSWDRRTLMRRIGPSVDGLNDEQLEQVFQVSGIQEDQLRKMYIDLTPPPPLLAESIRRFQVDRRYGSFIEQMRSPDPMVYSQADPDLQLELLTHEKIWPSSRGLSVIGTEHGDTIYQAPVGSQAQAQVAISEQALYSGQLLDSVVAELNNEQLQVVLGEDVQEARLREGLRKNPSASVYAHELNKLLQRPRDPGMTLSRLRLRLALAARLRRDELLTVLPQSTDEPARWVQEAFSELPAAAVDQMLEHTNETQRNQLSTTQRPPLQLSQEAREYLDAFRLQRTYEGLYLNEDVSEDMARLALRTLKDMPGWSDTVRIELREGSFAGPLLDSIGPLKAKRTGVWIKHADGRVGSVWHPYDTDRFYESLFAMVPTPDVEVMVYPAETRWVNLRQALRRHAPTPDELRSNLDMPAVRQDHQSPLALARGARGYSAQVPSTRALQCQLEAQKLYPGSTLEQIEEYLNVKGQGDAFMLKEVRRRQVEFDRLGNELEQWAGTHRSKLQVAQKIKAAWQRRTEIVRSNVGEVTGYALNLNDCLVEDLPILTVEIPHVSSLSLRRMGLTDNVDAFLGSFKGLRHLVLSGNRLTRLPKIIGSMSGLTQLSLEANQLQLTPDSVTALARLKQLRVLSLAKNPLVLAPDVSAMTQLDQLYLSDCGLLELPIGALELRRLKRLDVNRNALVELPDALFQRTTEQNRGTTLGENPLSQQTRDRIEAYRHRSGVALLDRAMPRHVTESVALLVWLEEMPAAQRLQLTQRWQDLRVEPGADAFFRLLADMTRSATYKAAAARAALAEQVWELISDVSQDEALRREIFKAVDAPGTCVDQRTDVLFKLRLQVRIHKAGLDAGTVQVEPGLIELGKGHFRLVELDKWVSADIAARESASQARAAADAVYVAATAAEDQGLPNAAALADASLAATASADAAQAAAESGAPGLRAANDALRQLSEIASQVGVVDWPREPFSEGIEVDLVYRTSLADRLKLPLQPRHITFGDLYPVNESLISQAGDTVLEQEAVPGALARFLVEEPFWENHLRRLYATEIEQRFSEPKQLLQEKSSALDELETSVADYYQTENFEARASYQEDINEMVAEVTRLFGLEREQVVEPSGLPHANFISTQQEALGENWALEEKRALVAVTQSILDRPGPSDPVRQ